MAPKKQQQQKRSTKPSSKGKPQPSGAKPAPKLQISAENERRLRRLLLNTERPPAAPQPAAAAAAVEVLSRDRRAKRLRNVYDKLSLEGFSSDQIEQALSVLNERATFETALDWLCLNIPGHELPLKFSTGASAVHEDRSIKIISTAREDWVPIQRPVEELEHSIPEMSIRIKGNHDEESLELGGSSQADWIRQYMDQQNEVEEEEVEEDKKRKEEADPSSRASSIAKEYHHARLGALAAKQKGDRKRQDYFGDIIYKLKQEMSSLGLSDDILVSGLQNECTNLASEMSCDCTSCTMPEFIKQYGAGNSLEFVAFESGSVINSNIDQGSGLRDEECAIGLMDTSVIEEAGAKNEAADDLELDNLFSEDSSSFEVLQTDRLKLQKREKLSQLGYGCTLGNIDDIWTKGDPGRIPKAVLQKLCQRLGWEAPKYNKLFEKEDKFLYAVSVLRTATGRGKSRKAGGLITIQLPEQAEALGSVEDAQNKVAAYALSQLFPDLPLHQMLTEPYASFIIKCQEDEISTKLEDNENIRRAGFVDSLLYAETSPKMSSMDAADVAIHEKPLAPHDLCKEDSNFPVEVSKVLPSANTGRDNQEQSVSIFLKKELDNKLKLPMYREMLEARNTLPIAKLKRELLQLLTENDVIIVSGETGCGKTTQVPQFILDDMIESRLGGQCNIICTQPRRIAAISVAERVSDERCESPPGSDGSLIGYQVRLDSARNEKTKLLFCTTGILLRKLAGNKDLAGITHVIVDEVHERSLLGDFLLIVLKNHLRRQSSQGRQKLKVVLMSATVDSTLFSRYFGNCPVLGAEGRMHPVSTYFLEDVYEKLEYCLPSDSPASGILTASTRSKLSGSSVDNHRGKKNLVLSSWGDESLLSEDYINPFYESGFYVSYSERTRENLEKLKEEVIDYDLLEDLICYIDETYPPGAILVFLPGVAEIELLVDRLTASYQFGGMSSDWVFPLHSSLGSTDQKKVFLSPPQHLRKVIVATDIAETSITINDVIYVIDTGKHKENRYNPQKKMSSMVEDWISQANAKQRRGRAGRVKPGICFCLYTRHRFEVLMRPFQVPEMLRMPLTELCLQIKSLSLGDIRSFLMEAIEPPREEAVSSAIDLLYKVGAFEGEEELSPLGCHLAKLPVDVLIGKMMVYGAVFGCLSPILSIASFLSYKFPFVSPKDEKQNAERAKSDLLNDRLNNGTPSSKAYGQSDHLLMAVAYSRWARILHKDGAKAAHRFCRSFFLNSSVMYMIRDMRVQFGSLLADIGLVDLPKLLNVGKTKDKLDSWFADISQLFNMHAHHPSVIKSVICAGLYPNVAATMEGIVGSAAISNNTSCSSLPVNARPCWYDGRREVHVHPSSVNHNLKSIRYPFLVFLEKVETTKVFLRDTSIISPYSILLFGGPITVQYQTGLVIIDGWLKLTAPAQIAVLFKELRLTLHAVLKELIHKPEVARGTDNEVVRSIIHLLLEEDKASCS